MILLVDIKGSRDIIHCVHMIILLITAALANSYLQGYRMSVAETVFIIVSSIILSLLLFYEIVFVLFYRTPERSSQFSLKKEAENIPAADIIVQPKPLGYGEAPAGKYEQCKTPVLELAADEQSSVKEDNNKTDLVHLKASEKDAKKAPMIVVTSPTL